MTERFPTPAIVRYSSIMRVYVGSFWTYRSNPKLRFSYLTRWLDPTYGRKQ